MLIKGVIIDDTFAEAFYMSAARLVLTAQSENWALIAAQAAVGLAISIIGCGCEAGLENKLDKSETPDGRYGYSILLFTRDNAIMEQELIKRIGQAVLTTPTSACFNGLKIGEGVSAGGKVRYFGDGFQSSKYLAGTRYWRIPVAEGEFLLEETYNIVQAVAGGNFQIIAGDQGSGLEAAEAASIAINALPDVITPFPGGICRSGSKVGSSRYNNLLASTNDKFCPTLVGRINTQLSTDVKAVYEILVNGLTKAAVEKAMNVGIKAACRSGVISITAGNYGGNLGPVHLYLHQIMSEDYL